MLVTFGVPSPVAKSHPARAGKAGSSVLFDTDKAPKLSPLGTKQLSVPEQGTSMLPNVTSRNMQALPTVLPLLESHLAMFGRLGFELVPNCE